MDSVARVILKEGRRLSEAVPQHFSTDLAPVWDVHGLRMVPSWRQNGWGHEHALHAIMPRVGGFPPALARYFIAAYSKPGDVVLDPFCGKGTALFEATAMGRNAIGGDVAPDAVIAARAKCSKVSLAHVAAYIQSLDAARCSSVRGVPPEVKVFFHRSTLHQLLSIRDQLLRDLHSTRYRRPATLVCAAMLGLLHGHSQLSLSLPSNHCFAMSPAYVRRYVKEHGLQRPIRDVKECLLARFMELLPSPRASQTARIHEATASRCATYVGKSRDRVSLVLTSPPYLDRQTYIKDSWLRLWFLARDRQQVSRQALETGSIPRFVDRMRGMLASILRAASSDATVVLVCGRARNGSDSSGEAVRISELCLYALNTLNGEGRPFKAQAIIQDHKLMTRGSYFAVHGGVHKPREGPETKRYGEEEVLVLQLG